MDRTISTSRTRAAITALLGVALFAAAIGMFLPVEGDSSGTTPDYNFATLERLSCWSDSRLQRFPEESDLELAKRLTQVVHGAVFHCDPGNFRHLGGALALKFLKHAGQGLLSPAWMNCGFCRQVAHVLARALRLQGVDAIAFALNGHVVTLFRHGQDHYVSDPDVGVGPILFGADLWSRAEPKYLGLPWVSNECIEVLRPIFSSIEDDRPYYSTRFLDQLESKQSKALNATGALCFLAGVVDLVFVCAAIHALAKMAGKWSFSGTEHASQLAEDPTAPREPATS